MNKINTFRFGLDDDATATDGASNFDASFTVHGVSLINGGRKFDAPSSINNTYVEMHYISQIDI